MAGLMSRASLVIVLAEDKLHQRFARRFLYQLGFERHQVRFCDLPSGRGAGEQWVRDNYGRQVAEFRKRQARASSALLVVIDADVVPVASRTDQLATALSERDEQPRLAGESICHLIPKRSIETWLLCLTGEAVNEDTTYKDQQGVEGLVSEAATAFYAWSRPYAEVPGHCVDSLRQAIPEAQRIQPK